MYGGYYYAADTQTKERDQADDVAALLKAGREDFSDVEVSTHAMCGNAVPMLIEAARDARLLVVGAHRHRALLSVGMGYVVQGDSAGEVGSGFCGNAVGEAEVVDAGWGSGCCSAGGVVVAEAGDVDGDGAGGVLDVGFGQAQVAGVA